MYPVIQRQLQKCFSSAEEKDHSHNLLCVSSLCLLSIPCALLLPSAAQVLLSPPPQLFLAPGGLCTENLTSLYPSIHPTGPQDPGNHPVVNVGRGMGREQGKKDLLSLSPL